MSDRQFFFTPNSIRRCAGGYGADVSGREEPAGEPEDNDGKQKPNYNYSKFNKSKMYSISYVRQPYLAKVNTDRVQLNAVKSIGTANNYG